MAKTLLYGLTVVLLGCSAQLLTPEDGDVLVVPPERGLQLISLLSNSSTMLLLSCAVMDVTHDPIQDEIYALAECQERKQKVIVISVKDPVVKILNVSTSFKLCWDSRLLQMTQDRPIHIELDWIGRNLYISSHCGALRMCNIVSLNCVTIQLGGKPAVHLALDPRRGLVFWTVIGSRSIFRADLDGLGMKTIYTNLTSAGVFDLDDEQGRLYWKSMDTSVVESCDTDGKGFQTFESITDTTQFKRAFPAPNGAKMYFIRLLGNRHLFVRGEDRSQMGTSMTWSFNDMYYPDHLTSSALLLRKSSLHQPWTQKNVSSACVDSNCSHICVLAAERGHSCLCDEGFYDDQMGNCVAFEEKLLLATSQSLFVIGLNNGTVRKTVGEHTRISRSHFDSRETAKIVLNLENPGVKNSYELQVLAYDWITGNMYLVFERARRIHACNVTAKVCAELLGNQVAREVGGLALHPTVGSMFWTQRDRDSRGILRASMDGSAPKFIRTEGVDQPAGITIDFENSFIFWLDLSKGQIESTDLDGNNYRRVFVTNRKYTLQHIVLHPGKGIYLAGNATLRRDDGVLLKQSKTKETLIFTSPMGTPISGIAIQSFRSQPNMNGNRCGNQSCTGLCLLAGDSFQCACPEGTILKSDGVSCKELEEPILIYSADHGISVCRNTCEHEVLAVESNKVKAVSYSNHRRSLFWTTDDEHIREAYIGGGEATNSTVLVNTKVRISRGSLQYDWVGENIYFISERNGRVGMCSRLSSTCTMLDPKIITKLGSTIAVDPMRGGLYWCADEGLQRSGMDGSHISKLTEGLCQGPLATDGYSLFFASQGALKSSDLHAGNSQTLVDLGGNPEMLVVAGPAVFWTLYSYPVATVYSCDKFTANNLRVHKVTVRSPILDIHVAYKASQSLRDRNPCVTRVSVPSVPVPPAVGGGLCSHICALTSTGYMRCLCPEGLRLAADGFNCKAGAIDQNDTILDHAVSFGPERRKRCPAGDQFRCLTSYNDVGCVNVSQVCDGMPDCPDISDEGPRCNEPCSADHGCDHGCVSSPIGPLCTCPSDEHWDDPGKKCIRFLLENNALPTKSLQVALSVVAGIAIALLLVAGISVQKYRKAQEKMRNLTQEEIQEFLRGNQAAADAAADGVEKAMSLPYQINITPGSLVYARDTVLGSGEFGVVHPGVWNNTEAVAVKTFKRTVGIDEFKAILAEVKIMTYLGQHSHIVKFLGADVSEIAQRKIIVVTELSPYGDLLRHLRTVSVSKVSSGILINWCQQIADGMEYLTSKQIVHGDLAARNVLVFNDDVVKISDFGLSKQLYGCGQYIMRRQGKIPWKWASIELITCSEFSEASDVWAFGITAWEIFTLGQTPYKGMRPGEQFVQYLRQGNRLDKPDHAPEPIYKMLLKCWDMEKGFRPTFSVLNVFLQEQFSSFRGNQNGKFGTNIESSYVVAH